MNCIIEPFINDIDLAICIFPSDAIQQSELAVKMTDFTLFYALRLNQMCQTSDKQIEIYTAESIDSGLAELSTSHKHILFMAAGVRIFDQSIIFDIKNEILKNPDYFVAGHILEWKQDWYELHHQFVLVNTQTWQEIGKPEFGDWNPVIDVLPVVVRSEENFHDDYTPLWIKYDGESREQLHTKQGWNFIATGLINNKPILNWDKNIRNKRTYYYPEDNGERFLNALQTWEIDKTANANQRMLINGLKKIAEQVWILNTELMDVEVWNEKFDTVAFPAAGFKFLDVFTKDMLNENGKIVIFDFNQISLDWIKYLHTSSSNDIEYLISEFEHKDKFVYGGSTTVFGNSGHFTRDFLDYYKTTLEYFGGRGNFINLINKFRNTIVEFVHADLIKEPKLLVNRFDGKTLVNISNIYCTDFSNTVLGVNKTAEYLKTFLDFIKTPTMIIGQDAYCRLIKKQLNYST